LKEKKYKMKKIVALFLVFVLTIAVLAACQNNDDTHQSEINGTESGYNENNGNGDITDEESAHWAMLGERDFEGVTFTILDANAHPHLFHNVPEEEFTGDAINDALIHRNLLIEEKFNINIEYVHIPGGASEGTNVLRQSIRAGEDSYDMIISRAMGGDLATLATQGYLQNLAALPYMSLQSPWWSRLMYQNMQFDGNLFFTMGDIVPVMYQAPFAVFFNKQMMADRGIEENLYELVMNGQWTLDAMERLARDVYQDINMTGAMNLHEDIFGIITQNNSFTTNGIAAAVGINLSTIENNDIVVNFNTQHVFDRVSRLTDVFQRGTVPAGDEIITVTFYEGRALFLVHLLESGMIHLRGMEQDFGILPMPKFNEQQESHISPINPWNGGFVAAPLSADSARTAFMMEALSYASYSMVRPQVYEVVLHHRVARDEESARMIDTIIETSYLDLNGIYNWGGSTDALYRAIFAGGNLASEMERVEGLIESAIEDFISSVQGE